MGQADADASVDFVKFEPEGIDSANPVVLLFRYQIPLVISAGW